MTEQYSTYLTSEAWLEKRAARLKLSNGRCSVPRCRKGKVIHCHHLTYARVFNEDLADLLPLCGDHHGVAEYLIAAGKLHRHGEVEFLAAETLRLIAEESKPAKPKKSKKPKRRRKPFQLKDRLLADRSFMRLLTMPNRKEFQRAVGTMFGRTSRIMGTACALYDHRQRNRQSANRYGPTDFRDTLRSTGARRLRGLYG